MTQISSAAREEHCAAIRRQLDALADRIAQLERRDGRSSLPAVLDPELRGLEALLARAEFADPERWPTLVAELDARLTAFRQALPAEREGAPPTDGDASR